MINATVDTPSAAAPHRWVGLFAFFRGLFSPSDQPRLDPFLPEKDIPMEPSTPQPEPVLAKPSDENSSFFLDGDVLWMRGCALETADGRSIAVPDRPLCTLHPDVPAEGRDWVLKVFSSRFVLKEIETAAAHLAATLLHPEAQVTAQDIAPVVQGLMATHDGRKIMRNHVSTIEARISEAKSTATAQDPEAKPSVQHPGSEPDAGHMEKPPHKAEQPRRRRRRKTSA